MASDSTERAKFVASVVPFLQKYNFDGLDMDWEYPSNRGGAPEDKVNIRWDLVFRLISISGHLKLAL